MCSRETGCVICFVGRKLLPRSEEYWRCLTVFIYCACGRIEKLKRSSDFVRIRELSVKSDFARPALFTPLGFASEIHCLTLPRFCKSSYGKSRKKRTAHIVSNLLCVQPLSAFPDFSPSFVWQKHRGIANSHNDPVRPRDTSIFSGKVNKFRM